MHQILVIEDDQDIAELIRLNLEDIQCRAHICNNGLDGQLEALNGNYDLIVLDLNLPGKNGLDVCKELRTEKVNTPILMLTARTEEIDRVLGLESGADDYLVKPFSVRELQARIKAIFRRSRLNEEAKIIGSENHITVKGLVIDKNKRVVLKNGLRIELTPKEFDLILLLAENPGKTYSRTSLLSQVWGYEYPGYEHTVNSHINRLRSKIESDMNNPEYVITTWGVGYRFTDEIDA